MIRKFRLTNEYAESYDLTASPRERALFLSPAGLGLSRRNSYTRLGSAYVRTDSVIDQAEISGEVICTNYTALRGFLDFVAGSQALKLCYSCIDGEGEYYRDVDFVKIEKSEIEEDHVLHCPVSMKCKSLYYRDASIVYVVDVTDLDRRYAIPYPNRYSDYAQREDILQNDGHVPASLSFTVHGYCENPRIRIMDGETALYDITFPVILQEGEALNYSSADGDTYITKTGESGEENLIQELDLENDNFIRIPVGSCKIRFTSETGTANRTSYVLHKFYEVV